MHSQYEELELIEKLIRYLFIYNFCNCTFLHKYCNEFKFLFFIIHRFSNSIQSAYFKRSPLPIPLTKEFIDCYANT